MNPWRSHAAERKFWDMIWFLEFMPKSIRRRSRRRLGEIIWRGWIDVDGNSEKVHITVRRNGRLPKGDTDYTPREHTSEKASRWKTGASASNPSRNS